MEEFFEFLVFVGMIVLAIYSNKKKKEKKLEEVKKAEAERQRRAAQSQNAHKSSSNDIVRRRKAQQAEADASRIHTSIHEKEEESPKATNSIADAVAAKVAAAEANKLEKYDFEDQDLMQEVYDLMAYGYDGSDFLRRLEKENRFQSSLDATINA